MDSQAEFRQETKQERKLHFESFMKRLTKNPEKRSCVAHIYKRTDEEGRVREGLISLWRYQGLIRLTWEECFEGQQYDEDTYTRDEVHAFETTESLLKFLGQNGLSCFDFAPA